MRWFFLLAAVAFVQPADAKPRFHQYCRAGVVGFAFWNYKAQCVTRFEHPQRHTARRQHVYRHPGQRRSGESRPYNPAGTVTISTAAGISITVASHMATKFAGFISDLVARGYRPRSIYCLSRGHMWNSMHHTGEACDFDQRARSITAKAMYHVADLADKWGLTDGCRWRYRDCGHISGGQ